jgi:hypothetical protein
VQLLIRLATPELRESSSNALRGTTRGFPFALHSCPRVKRFDLPKLLHQRSFKGQHLDDLGVRAGLDADALRASLLDPRARRQSRDA